jgi:hypothetical protein
MLRYKRSLGGLRVFIAYPNVRRGDPGGCACRRATKQKSRTAKGVVCRGSLTSARKAGTVNVVPYLNPLYQ